MRIEQTFKAGGVMKRLLAAVAVAGVLGLGFSENVSGFALGASHAVLGSAGGIGSMTGMWQIEILMGSLRIVPGWCVDSEGRIKMTPVTVGFQTRIKQKFISPFIGIDLKYYKETNTKDELFNDVLPFLIGSGKEAITILESYGLGAGKTVLWGVEAKAGIEIGIDEALCVYCGLGYGYTMMSTDIAGSDVTFGLGNVTFETGLRIYVVPRKKIAGGSK